MESFIIELIQYLKGEKYLIDENSCTMTKEFEKRASMRTKPKCNDK